MKNKKSILLTIALVSLVGLFFIFPLAQALPMPPATDVGLSNKSVTEILTKVVTWLLGIVGIIALISFIVAGIMYLVSAGSDKMVESAKKTMTYALVGIAVVLSSYVIVKAVDKIINVTSGTP